MGLTLKEIKNWCETEKKEMWEFMLEEDMRDRMVSKEESMQTMAHAFDVMCETIDSYRIDRLSASKLVGEEGGKLENYREQAPKTKKKALCGDFMGDAMIIALKMAESNACMRRVVAAPTAGACGVLPAVLIPYLRHSLATKEDITKALYVAGAVGQVIADKASISGAHGGCQAEIGSASSMSAAALTFLQGGSTSQIMHAAALAMKGLLGLVCDPVAGLVEVPCVKRNVIGTVNAISCTDMAMAGIESKIPPDEVFDAMDEIGQKMDSSLKETALGGLAATKTGMSITKTTTALS